MQRCVLGIDTAAPVIGISAATVPSPGHPSWILGAWSRRQARGAEQVLVEAVAPLVAGTRVEAVAVATGPGTFTGVRVGVATALGLAEGWGVPVVPLSSLAVRAAMAGGHARVLALLDARKDRLYGRAFDTRHPLPVPLGPERDAPAEVLAADPPSVLVGEGTEVMRRTLGTAYLGQRGHRPVIGGDRSPAELVASMGALEFLRRGARDPGQVRIHYLRPPDVRPPSPAKRSH